MLQHPLFSGVGPPIELLQGEELGVLDWSVIVVSCYSISYHTGSQF